MAEKPKMPNATAGARRKRAPPPTIDLTATEMSSAPAAGKTPPPPPPPRPQQPPPDREAGSAADRNAAAGNPWNWLSANFTAATLAAGIAGAAMVTLVLFALWLSGLVPIRYAGSTAMRARVAGLEMQMHDLQKRPAGAPDTKSIDALNERVSKIDDKISKLGASDPGAAERMAVADNAMQSLGVALAALNRRSDDIAGNVGKALERAEAADKAVTELRTGVQELVKDAAKNTGAGIAPAELEVLQKRIAALEQSVKLARDEIAKTTAIDTPARLALSAAVLRAAVSSGAPFTAELAQAKSFGADANFLAALEPFAATGVPTSAALAEALRALLPSLLKASAAPAPAGGFLERLQANAGKLVRIRPVDAPPGDEPSALLARIEIEASHADIAAALADLGKLSDKARAPALDWIARARNRQAALAAARAFAAATAGALGTKAGAR